jgi:hypothetical protein
MILFVCVGLLILPLVYVFKIICIPEDNIPGPILARVTKFYRIWLYFDGRGPITNYELAKKYGPVLRVGPNHVSVSNPELIPVIYDLRQKFKKSNFYWVFRPLYKGVPLETVFTTADPIQHKALRYPLATHLTSTRSAFPEEIRKSVDILVKRITDHDGKSIDFVAWSFYWAFDLSSSLIFGEYCGYMEHGTDVNGIIRAFIEIIRPATLLGQVPEFSPFLLGSDRVMTFLRKFESFPDPTQIFLKVNTCN